MIVREALLSDPRVLRPGASVRDAADVLARPNVESVFVADEDNRLLGCVTKDAIVAAVAAGQDLGGLTVGDLAVPDVTTVGPETPLDEALRLMAELGLSRLAVTDDGRLLGVVAREPALRRLAEDEPPPSGDEAAPQQQV